jgi:hypothetical protein
VVRSGLAAAIVASALAGASGASSVARAQQPDDATALRGELAERLLQGVMVPPPTAGQVPSSTVALRPGTLPADLSADFPLPPGARVVGSAIWGSAGTVPPPPGSGSTEIVLDVPDSPANVQAYYATALPARGWRPNATPTEPQGGFQSAASGSYCTPTNRLASLRVSPQASGMSDVRFRLQVQPGPPCAVPPGAPPAAVPPPSARALLPSLQPPAGVLISPRVVPPTVPGGTYAFSDARAETDLSVTDLEALFASQLRDANWTLLDGVTESAMAWSRWQVPGSGDRQGWLFVLAGPGARDRVLSLRV